MLERLHPGDYQTPYESRRSDQRDIDGEPFVPLYLSDSDGEPDPSEYMPPLRRRSASISARILAGVCAAAGIAVGYALISSDEMRDLINIKASMASIFPAPSVAAPANASLPSAPSKDPTRLSSPANKTAGAPTIKMASVTPTRDEMRNAYQSALQSQAPPAAAAAPPAAVAPPAAPVAVLHRLDPSEVAASMKRADGLISSGDIAAARLVLQRVADDGDAQAAVTLAETYDPAILDRLGVHGTVPDIALARKWYEAAQRFGSVEATQRLAALTSANH